MGGGPGGLDLSAITAVKLKKVGVPTEDRQKVTESDKIYDEDAGVKSAFEKFKLKGMFWVLKLVCGKYNCQVNS
jgi:hypothetical protein